MNTKQHSITLIGAGKLAWSLTPALIKAGYEINSVISRKLNDAKKLSIKNKIRRYSDSLKDVPPDTDIIMLSIPDDQLELTADKLSELFSEYSNKIFIHFSGACNIDVLESLASKGASTASLHIMQTFPSKRKVEINKSNSVIEFSDERGKKLLSAITADLGLNSFEIDSDKKTAYHLAGVFASNFLVSNLYSARQLFDSTGADTDFITYLKPIIQQTLKNIKDGGVEKALSGPVDRGDIETVKKHVNNLKENDGLLLQIYLVQSMNILRIKKKQGIMSPAHFELEEYLKNNLAGNQ